MFFRAAGITAARCIKVLNDLKDFKDFNDFKDLISVGGRYRCRQMPPTGTPHHTTPHHIALYRTTSHHTTSHHIAPHHTAPHRCNSSFPPLPASPRLSLPLSASLRLFPSRFPDYHPRPTKKRPAPEWVAGRFVVSEPLSDYFIASRFTSFFAFAARAESLAIALFNWLLASLRLPSFAAMTARR